MRVANAIIIGTTLGCFSASPSIFAHAKQKRLLRNSRRSRKKTEETKAMSTLTCLDELDVYRTCNSKSGKVKRSKYYPYVPPKVSKTSTLSTGDMHIVFSGVKASFDSCEELLNLEETILDYLFETTGSKDTFTPRCVAINSQDATSEVLRENGDATSTADGTAIGITVTFSSKNEYLMSVDAQNDVDEGETRMLKQPQPMEARKLDDVCSRADESCDHHPGFGANPCAYCQVCCMQSSINAKQCCPLKCACGKGNSIYDSLPNPSTGSGSLPNPSTGSGSLPNPSYGSGEPVGRMLGQERDSKYVRGKDSNPLEASRRIQDFDLSTSSFTSFVAESNAALSTTEDSTALIEQTNTSKLLLCALNYEIVTRVGGVSSLTCDQFEEYGCGKDTELTFDSTHEECLEPSSMPSSMPSSQPSSQPSTEPSSEPSSRPSDVPSTQPSDMPSVSSAPSSQPSDMPSVSSAPSAQPSDKPSVSAAPSSEPSEMPSVSDVPSSQPSDEPSLSTKPSEQPSDMPSVSSEPSSRPSSGRSSQPSEMPSFSDSPSLQPSDEPSISSAPS